MALLIVNIKFIINIIRKNDQYNRKLKHFTKTKGELKILISEI